MEHEHMHVPPDRQRAQHVEVPRGQPRQPKERDPGRQIDERGIVPQPRTSALNSLRLIWNPDPLAQPPPELRLPHAIRGDVPILPASPGTNHLRPMQRVAIEQLREMPNRTEPPSPTRRVHVIGAPAQMRGQAGEPRLPQTPIHHLEQSPNRPLRQPRIRIRLDPRRRRHRIPDKPPGRREVDVRAHPIAPPIRCPKPVRHPLGEPPLHPARRHGNDLGREWLGHRVGQQHPKRLDKAVSPLGSMDVEHVAKFRGYATRAHRA
jgi:hypothetical protein